PGDAARLRADERNCLVVRSVWSAIALAVDRHRLEAALPDHLGLWRGEFSLRQDEDPPRAPQCRAAGHGSVGRGPPGNPRAGISTRPRNPAVAFAQGNSAA